MFQFESFPELVSSRPATCSWGPNRLDIFWADGAGRLQHRWYDARFGDFNWHTETLATTATLSSPPAACSLGEERIDVFWREPSGALHRKWYDHGWRGEESLSASMPSGPAACALGGNIISIFWRNRDNTLHQRWFDAGWHDLDFPAAMTSDPAACSWGAGRLDVFWRGTDGTLRQKWYDAGWHNEFNHGGSFVGAPTACAWPGVVDVFVRKSDNTLWHRWYEGGWHSWRQREGQPAAEAGVVSWGDGRLDIFVPGMDGHLWHAWYSSVPLATHSDAIKSLWGFVASYNGPDKITRLQGSFAAGLLNGGCSGAMISPHIFMTASHCDGPGWTGGVNFYRMDQFAAPPDDGSQQLSPTYQARTFPWQEFGQQPTLHGDTILWWLPDGPDGIPPGIKYGYLELSETAVGIGTSAYSFWSNPALRAVSTLLYSEGPAISNSDGGSLGPFTNYAMWSVTGASGSANLSGAGPHGNRVVGVTSLGGGGIGRTVVDTKAFLQHFDADGNRVADPVDYDWLFTQPIQRFYLLTFETPFKRARWVGQPDGSGTSVGPMQTLTGLPTMSGQPNMYTEGFWHHFARFAAGATYRLSVVASGTQTGSVVVRPNSYVKFRSDSTGDEVVFGFTPAAAAARFVGRVTLGNNSDYRLILGTQTNTTVQVESLAITAEVGAFGFETHDERLSWEYTGGCRPTSWGTRGAENFSGAVVGPTPAGWGIRNRFLGLMPSTSYRVSFVAKHVTGPRTAGSCYLRVEDLGAHVAAEYRFTFASDGAVQSLPFTFTTPAAVIETIAFGADTATTYLVSDLQIAQI
jgi:hypothetical protein